MRYFLLFFIFLFLNGCISRKGEDHIAPPNIVYINVDDLGWKDTQVYGSDLYETPNINALAQNGMLFTQAYAAASNCAPSRAALMSGMYAPRTGIYTVGNSDRGKARDRKIIPIQNKKMLPDSIETLADVLQKDGYKTISIGKWHLGASPTSQGFDQNVAGNTAGHPRSYFSPYKNKNLPDGPEGEYLTERLTNEAIEFLKTNATEKFFLYLPYFTIHTPIQGKEELIKKYEQKLAQLNPSEGKKPHHQHATYAAMVEAMDANVGRIVKALKDLELLGNTLLFFTSDNGGICKLSTQYPLRAGKGSYYEGGIRIPLIAQWPKKIQAGTICKTPVINLDIYPTVLELMDKAESSNQAMDGQSLLPLLFENGTFATRKLYWHFPIYLQKYGGWADEARDSLFRTRPGSVMLDGDWKLHEYFEDGALELYILQWDISERNNIITLYPEQAKQMQAQLGIWRKQTEAKVSKTLNPEFVSQ